MYEVQFTRCKAIVWHEAYLETVFEDHVVAPALFIVNDETRATALSLGYGDDVQTMHLDHELAHTFLSEALGRPWRFNFICRPVTSCLRSTSSTTCRRSLLGFAR